MKINCVEIIDKIRNQYDLTQKKYLTVIQVGNDEASNLYINSKVKEAEKWNVEVTVIKYDENVSTDKIVDEIENMNINPLIDGIIVQLPLPKHIDTQKVLDSISASKNVDGFKQTHKPQLFEPCTPLGIIMLLKTMINLEGKVVTVVGRGKTVGEPLRDMLLRENATVCVCHSKTTKEQLYDLAVKSDVVILAVGKPNMIGAWHLKKNAIVIDAGISRINGKQVGDFSHNYLETYENYIQYTPWTNGVGKLTVASLMMNVREGLLNGTSKSPKTL